MEKENIKIELKIPPPALDIVKTLKNKGFSAYLVGGCVRDSLMNRPPKDWDITTNAKPEDIVAIFPKTVYENKFGTVTIVNEDLNEEESQTLKNIEVTPYRQEATYSDQRHPDEVRFCDRLEDDLSRRDFTINALAYDPEQAILVDLYGGIKDIKDKIIRTVGPPDERFQEDALRLLRAVRFAAELGFTLNSETQKSLFANAELIKKTSAERIRDEFVKIIMSPRPMEGIGLMKTGGLLKYIIPELERGIAMEQGGEHIYDVWTHTLLSVQHAADKNWPLHVRLAALFHDIGKAKTRRPDKKGKKTWTFYGHEVLSEQLTKEIMGRLKFPVKLTETTLKLVRNHMFFADPDKITLSAVRRVVAKVGPDLIWDLMNLRVCDRIGMGRPKEEPYRLRKYQSMIEEALRAPTSVGMLKIDGNRLMEITGEGPGPKIGMILNGLMEEVLEKPELNTENYLEEKALELAKLPKKNLKELAERGKEKKEELEVQALKKIRGKYKVN